MTIEDLKQKYPHFLYGNDGKGGDEYVFTANENTETKTYIDVTLELSCEVEELISDESFLKWLDETWSKEKVA